VADAVTGDGLAKPQAAAEYGIFAGGEPRWLSAHRSAIRAQGLHR
jgi:hypothetical protein